jgi:hypothetical protein
MQSNAQVFDHACPEGVTLQHTVRPEFLSKTEAAGRLTPEVEADVVATLVSLARDADGVLLTCSSIGAAVQKATLLSPKVIVRADESLALASAEPGRPILVLCAFPTTLEPSRKLFEAAAAPSGIPVKLELVAGAREAFQAGKMELYWELIATAADAAANETTDVIAFAQASMTGAAGLCRAAKPLTSPSAGIRAIEAAILATSR